MQYSAEDRARLYGINGRTMETLGINERCFCNVDNLISIYLPSPLPDPKVDLLQAKLPQINYSVKLDAHNSRKFHSLQCRLYLHIPQSFQSLHSPLTFQIPQGLHSS
jgi:hypothetical protein